MTSRKAWCGALAALTLSFAPSAHRLSAQTDTASGSRSSEFETRAVLEARARAADSMHRTSEAWLLRSRLEKGDFQEGDRIVVMLHSSAAKQPIDTLVVRAGKVLQLPKMDDLPLEGVLRSELNDRFVKHLAKYLKDPEARTTPLLRIGVFGAVGTAGYHYVSADLVLNDLLMRAGGLGAASDLNKIKVRRGETLIWSEKETRTALTEGMSLDRLQLRSGDEVVVGAKRQISWTNVITATVGLLGLAIALVNLR